MTWQPTDVDADPNAPRKVADLPGYWDQRRLIEGKTDRSRCAADLRQALEAASTVAKLVLWAVGMLVLILGVLAGVDALFTHLRWIP